MLSSSRLPLAHPRNAPWGVREEATSFLAAQLHSGRARPRNQDVTKDPNGDHCWSVILAGGDGRRLLPLTRLVTGDNRPKQFCPLLTGGKTLLEDTRTRAAKFCALERTVFVLNGTHEPFYVTELADVSPKLLVVQPENRGTLPAILASLARIVELDQQAITGFFPCDHHYSREDVFVKGTQRGFRAAHGSTKHHQPPRT